MEEAFAQLATQYFRAESPARVKDFAWWAGINVDGCHSGSGRSQTQAGPIAVEGTKDEFLISETDLDEFIAFTPAEAPSAFIPYRDTYLKGQREVVDRFVPAEHADKPFSRWKGNSSTTRSRQLSGTGASSVCGNGNEDDEEVDLLLFDPNIPKSTEKTIHKRALDLASFIRANLGDVRCRAQTTVPTK